MTMRIEPGPDANQKRALDTLTEQHAHLHRLRTTLEDCHEKFPDDACTAWQISRAYGYLGNAQGALEAALNNHGIEVQP